MSQTNLLETYTEELVYDDPENPQAARSRTRYLIYTFDSADLSVTPNAGTYDGPPLPNFSWPGEFHWDCAGTTRLSYVHNGQGGYTVVNEADSLSCGFTPPSTLTCDVAITGVTQVDTPGGATCTVAATGLHGRARYRLDGGSEQLSPVFYNVAPGKHRVEVRDDGLSSCRRAQSFDVAAAPPVTAPAGAPEGVDFVGQPLWFRTPVPAGAEVLVELWAESQHGQEDFQRIFVARKPALATGEVSTRLDTLLWPLLRPFAPPASTAATVPCRANLVNYFLRTAVLVPGRATTYATSALRTAVRGALPAEWRGRDYFAYRLDAYAQPPFLTWKPEGLPLTAEQPEWLFWLCPAAAPTQLTVRRSYVRTGFAGSPPVVEDEVVSLSAGRGPKNRLLAIPVRPRYGMDAVSVGLYGALDEALSPLLSYPLVAETARSRYVQFSNSLGGFDTLRTEGKLEEQLEATASLLERPAGPGDGAAAPERRTADVVASRKLKLATGWLPAEQQQWLQELVLARDVWQWDASRGLLPLLLAKRSLALGTDDPALRGAVLEFDYAFSPTASARY